MGRIKTKKIKRATQKIFAQTSDRLSANYDENKKVIGENYTFGSKKLRNIVAGYCTRLKKHEE